MRKIYKSGNLYGSWLLSFISFEIVMIVFFSFYFRWSLHIFFSCRCNVCVYACAVHLGAFFRFIRMSLIDIYGSKGWKFITANLVDDGLLFVCPHTLYWDALAEYLTLSISLSLFAPSQCEWCVNIKSAGFGSVYGNTIQFEQWNVL